MKDERADEALMRAFRDGESGAFDVLYARHRAPVFRYLARQLRDTAAAEDLYQDVWMRVINARARYLETAKFTTWLYTIAHHRLMDYFRAARLREAGRVSFGTTQDNLPIVEMEDSAETRPEQRLAREELAGRLLAAIADLPAAQREAFLLQQEAGLSIEDIGKITGVGPETAKSRLRYALGKLRRALQEES